MKFACGGCEHGPSSLILFNVQHAITYNSLSPCWSWFWLTYRRGSDDPADEHPLPVLKFNQFVLAKSLTKRKNEDKMNQLWDEKYFYVPKNEKHVKFVLRRSFKASSRNCIRRKNSNMGKRKVKEEETFVSKFYIF